jgi:hypothetical protein
MQGMIALALFAAALISAGWMLRYDFSGETTGGQIGFAVLDRWKGTVQLCGPKEGRAACYRFFPPGEVIPGR